MRITSIESFAQGGRKMLEIINLHVEVDEKEILKGISLQFKPGETHALMGPNGSGKSTLAHAIAGNPKYKITQGTILLDGKDITNEKPEIRAKLGLFLSFQHPPAISGVTISNFIRTAINEKQEKPVNVLKFHGQLTEQMKKLNIDPTFSRRYVHQGFSGGEKKRAEMLQLAMLKPNYAFLDETDSGLDVDSIKLVAQQIQQLDSSTGIIIITHYHKFLQYLKPTKVSILSEGKIIKQGGYELAQQIEEQGFTQWTNSN
jgi:Fe-S cluster assembly ATP-binding protein